jgi:DNA primase
MQSELENLKRRFPLIDYLQRHHWVARKVGCRQEYVGLCPLHVESHPSFYVNAGKNLFYCHGCGRGGDLIRFVQLYFHLPFRDSVIHLKQELGLPPPADDELLNDAVSFYQHQLHRHDEAVAYLEQRGLHDAEIIGQLRIGYAPGGNLRRHLAALGYSSDHALRIGLLNQQGRDSFYRRIVFPCPDPSRPINLYGRSIGPGLHAHRFLSRSKGGLFAWDSIRSFPMVILVEGLFDLAVLWQAGFRNTTCGFGTHLTQTQFAQLCDNLDRHVRIAFDSDPNGAGQDAAFTLAQRLQHAGLTARIVGLPEGQDPNSYFAAGATTTDFDFYLRQARFP